MDDSLDFSQMSKTKEKVEEEMSREWGRTQGRSLHEEAKLLNN